MCWAEKCCFFVKIDFGCILIGVVSFLFSGSMLLVWSLLFMSKSHLLLGSELSPGALRIISSTALLLCASNIGSAILLMIGVKKCKPGFLLCYFSVGIFSTILCQLGALLILLANHWAVAGALFGVSLIYIHFLVVVHTMYESLQQKEPIGDDSYDRLEESVET